MRQRITGEIKEICNKMNQSDEEQMPSVNPPPPGIVRLVDVQIYDVPAEDFPEDPFSVESTLKSGEENTAKPPVQAGNQGEPPQETKETTDNAPVTRVRLHPLPLALGILCVLFAGAVSVIYMLPLLAPSATVTIIPDSMSITTTTTVGVVIGTATALPHQLQGRALLSLAMSQAQTVPTTGIGHQGAQAAYGRITFYNAAPYAQTIAAGMLLTGADGVQVVTDQDAVIPVVAYPTLGQVTVSAHAVTTGPAGNIRAGDIYGPCCRLNVSAVNGAFSGGQDARSYRMVTAQDIHGVAKSLTISLEQSVQAALQVQVQSDETLIMPLPCKQKVTPDRAVGDEATQVQITVDEACTGEAYNTQAYYALIRQIVTQEANKRLGEGYSLSGDIQATINKVTTKDHSVVELEVTGVGSWTYQFNQEQLQRIKMMIVDKSEAQAKAIVLHIPGVHAVSFTIKNGTTIPTDTANIHLIFLEVIS